MKFLIADDSKVARKRVLTILDELNYAVVGEATNGLDAVEKFKELNPTVVIIDLEMPNLKGNEASKMILEIDPNVDIILITSSNDKKEILNAFNIGIKKVIRKPFTKELLEQTINELKG
ncbi:MAG: response regulator [Halarcobacter sp.]